jgi:hypothetical protein
VPARARRKAPVLEPTLHERLSHPSSSHGLRPTFLPVETTGTE